MIRILDVRHHDAGVAAEDLERPFMVGDAVRTRDRRDAGACAVALDAQAARFLVDLGEVGARGAEARGQPLAGLELDRHGIDENAQGVPQLVDELPVVLARDERRLRMAALHHVRDLPREQVEQAQRPAIRMSGRA
ncbi:MAG: hypothetical protein ACKOGH_01795 [Alphaproteobacteria bacterium]